jgi:hypothetical protein
MLDHLGLRILCVTVTHMMHVGAGREGGRLRKPTPTSRQLTATVPRLLACSQLPTDDLLPLELAVTLVDNKQGEHTARCRHSLSMSYHVLP